MSAASCGRAPGSQASAENSSAFNGTSRPFSFSRKTHSFDSSPTECAVVGKFPVVHFKRRRRSTSSQKLFNTSRSAHPDTCVSSPPSKAVPPSFSVSYRSPDPVLPHFSILRVLCCAAGPTDSVSVLGHRRKSLVGTPPISRSGRDATRAAGPRETYRAPASSPSPTSRHQVVDQRREAGIAAERHTCGHPRSTVSLRHPPEPPSTHPTQRIGTTSDQPSSVSVEAKLPARPQNPLPVRFAFDDQLVGHTGRKVFQ